MRAKQLVEASCCDVKYNGDEDTPMGLVIQPVHQDHIWHQADHEIDAVDQTSLGDVAVVIALDE